MLVSVVARSGFSKKVSHMCVFDAGATSLLCSEEAGGKRPLQPSNQQVTNAALGTKRQRTSRDPDSSMDVSLHADPDDFPAS